MSQSLFKRLVICFFTFWMLTLGIRIDSTTSSDMSAPESVNVTDGRALDVRSYIECGVEHSIGVPLMLHVNSDRAPHDLIVVLEFTFDGQVMFDNLKVKTVQFEKATIHTSSIVVFSSAEDATIALIRFENAIDLSAEARIELSGTISVDSNTAVAFEVEQFVPYGRTTNWMTGWASLYYSQY